MPSNSFSDCNSSVQCMNPKRANLDCKACPFTKSRSLEYQLSDLPLKYDSPCNETNFLKKLLIKKSTEAAEFKRSALNEINRLQEALAAESGDHAATVCAIRDEENSKIKILREKLAETQNNVAILVQQYCRLKEAFLKLANEISKIQMDAAENKQSIARLECQFSEMLDQRRLFSDQLKELECRLVWSNSCATQKQTDHQENYTRCQRLLSISMSLLSVLNEMEARLVNVESYPGSPNRQGLMGPNSENNCSKLNELDKKFNEVDTSNSHKNLLPSPSGENSSSPTVPSSDTTQDVNNILASGSSVCTASDTNSQCMNNLPPKSSTRVNLTVLSRKHAPRFCRYQSCDNIKPDKDIFSMNEFCAEISENIQKAEFLSVTRLPCIKPTEVSTAHLLCNPRPVIIKRQSYKSTQGSPDSSSPIWYDKYHQRHSRHATMPIRTDLESICDGALVQNFAPYSQHKTGTRFGSVLSEPIAETKHSPKNGIEKSKLFRMSRVWRSFRFNGKENPVHPPQNYIPSHSVLPKTKLQQSV